MKIKTKLLTITACALLMFGCGAIAACTQDKAPEAEKTVTGMTLELRNAKTDFYVGDVFSTVGLCARLTYEDGSQELKLVDEDNFGTLSPALDTVGRKQVTISYAGFVAQYSVLVSRIDELELSTRGVKQGYTVGEEFTYEGLTATLAITTVNNANEEVPAEPKTVNNVDLKVETPDLSTPGVKDVKVTYGKYDATYPVYVTPDVDDVISFTGENDLSLYITEKSGGGAGTKDATAKGWYLLLNKDGSFGMYETTITYTAADGKSVFSGDVTVAPSADGLTLEAAVNGKNYTVSSSVYQTIALGWSKQIVGFYLDTSAADREYIVGEAFSSEGLKMVAIYSDNTTEVVQGGSFEVVKQPTAAEMAEVGVKDVSVKYTATNGAVFDYNYQIFCIPEVNWETNRLELGADQNGSGATLDLFVVTRSTNPEGGYWGLEQHVEGLLLVRNTDGTFELHSFEYLLDTSVISHLYPNGAPEGIQSYLIPDDKIGGGNLIVEINGMKFAATDNNLWHLIVIGWQ